MGGGTIHFEIRAIFSILQQQQDRQWTARKMIEDGIVDSPPNRNVQPVIISSPSPLKAKSTTLAHMLGSFGDSRSSYRLYNIPSSFVPYRVLKVFSKTFTGI